MWYQRISSKRSRGVTLVELLVAMALTTLLTIWLVIDYSQSASVVDMSKAHMELDQVTTRVIDRLTPYISSAVAYNGLPAVAMPTGDGNTSQYIIFNTPEPLLDSGYEPGQYVTNSPASIEAFVNNYQTYPFVVWFEGDKSADTDTARATASTSYAVTIAELQPGYSTSDPFPSIIDTSTTKPRVLARSTRTPNGDRLSGALITDVTFKCLLLNAIEIQVTAKASFRQANRTTRKDSHTAVSVIQMPAGQSTGN